MVDKAQRRAEGRVRCTAYHLDQAHNLIDYCQGKQSLNIQLDIGNCPAVEVGSMSNARSKKMARMESRSLRGRRTMLKEYNMKYGRCLKRCAGRKVASSMYWTNSVLGSEGDLDKLRGRDKSDRWGISHASHVFEAKTKKTHRHTAEGKLRAAEPC